MLYSLIRPLLFRLDPEDAHERALAVATALGAHPPVAAAVRRLFARPAVAPVRLMGLDFPHRVGLAAGFDKNAVAPLAWWALGFGFVELGTVTPRPQRGNPRPRMFRLAHARALVNRMGFNNDGADVVAARLARQSAAGCRPAIPIGISVGKNADPGAPGLDRAVEDFASAAQRLAPHADFITLNVSSPNTPGLRGLQTRQSLTGLVAAVRAASAGRPVLVKIAPELDGPDLDDVVATCLESGAAGMIATNTLSTATDPKASRGTGILPVSGKVMPRTSALLAGSLPQGGLSGRPLRDISLRRVEQVRKRMGDTGILIGCGGIDDAKSARAMLSAGADLLQVYTGLIFEGPFLAARLSRSIGSRAGHPSEEGCRNSHRRLKR